MGMAVVTIILHKRVYDNNFCGGVSFPLLKEGRGDAILMVAVSFLIAERSFSMIRRFLLFLRCLFSLQSCMPDSPHQKHTIIHYPSTQSILEVFGSYNPGITSNIRRKKDV